MKYVLLIVAAAMLFGSCSGSNNDPAKQPENDSLKADINGVQQNAQTNDSKEALSSMSYGQAARCALLGRYFRDKDPATVLSAVNGPGSDMTEERLRVALNGIIAVAQNIAASRAETMNPRPDAASETGSGAVQVLADELALGVGSTDSLFQEMRGVCGPIQQSSELRDFYPSR